MEFTWRVSDWWCHLRKHLGGNKSKTTLCINGRGHTLPISHTLLQIERLTELKSSFRISIPVDRDEIVKQKSVEELNAQLVSLVGEDGAQLLVGALKSRRSISGPELAKCISIVSKHCAKYNINRFVFQ